jgi:hypothetical protein
MIIALEKIIDQSQRMSAHSITSISRWIRCIFQLALIDEPSIAEQVLTRVVSISKDFHDQADRYPAEELEWIATTAFNRAIDFYCANDDQACKDWVEKALAVSEELVDVDNGDTKRLLKENYLALGLD